MHNPLHGDYDAGGQGVPITDTLIRIARPFAGYGPDYDLWHGHYGACEDHADTDPAHNAWHIHRLAVTMLSEGKWIGGPLKYLACGGIVDGEHRYRALCYLLPKLHHIGIPQWPALRFAHPYIPGPEHLEFVPDQLVCWRGIHCPLFHRNP